MYGNGATASGELYELWKRAGDRTCDEGSRPALKARAALYAASPLFNPDNDKSKWIAAAEAAYEIIGNQSALGYTLDKNFANLFGTQNNRSQERLFGHVLTERIMVLRLLTFLWE